MNYFGHEKKWNYGIIFPNYSDPPTFGILYKSLHQVTNM